VNGIITCVAVTVNLAAFLLVVDQGVSFVRKRRRVRQLRRATEGALDALETAAAVSVWSEDVYVLEDTYRGLWNMAPGHPERLIPHLSCLTADEHAQWQDIRAGLADVERGTPWPIP